MKLQWVAHACFRLTAENGTTIITDPYDPGVGADMVPLRADVVTMSHEHHDHNEESCLVGSPLILHGTQEAEVGGVSIRAAASFHDDVRGEKRGPNAVRIFAIDGLKVVHMGDIGCMPDEDVMQAIEGADIMMLPVGGFFTVEPELAVEIVKKAAPRCVVPMHVRTKTCQYPIKPVSAFLELMGVAGLTPVPELIAAPGSAPQGVVLLKPEAYEL